jgi:hypothetical protein
VNRVGFETGNIRENPAPGQGLEFWEISSGSVRLVLAVKVNDREEIPLATSI